MWTEASISSLWLTSDSTCSQIVFARQMNESLNSNAYSHCCWWTGTVSPEQCEHSQVNTDSMLQLTSSVAICFHSNGSISDHKIPLTSLFCPETLATLAGGCVPQVALVAVHKHGLQAVWNALQGCTEVAFAVVLQALQATPAVRLDNSAQFLKVAQACVMCDCVSACSSWHWKCSVKIHRVCLCCGATTPTGSLKLLVIHA